MNLDAFESVRISPSATLRTALEVIDSSGVAVAMLVEADGRLVGLLTDGDARRALLGGASLEDGARSFATNDPHTVPTSSGRAQVLDLMRAMHVSVLPEVDDAGRVIGLHTLSEVVGAPQLPHTAVIMAGGKGTRLGALTAETPKPLMDVAGRTILDWIVLNLVGGGVHDIRVSVNHMAEQIEDHLGDGSRLGCRVRYLREDPHLPLGTAGSLALLDDLPDADLPILVMNGDLMVGFDPTELLRTHVAHGAAVTVGTRPYQHQVAYGVVETEDADTRVVRVREKPTVSLTVNAGVYAVSPSHLHLVPPGEPSTMPDLVERCLDQGLPVHAWPLASDWIDIGTPADLARAKGFL